MRVALDTNVLAAALRSKEGASVRAAYGGEFTIVANVALFAENEAVLTRPEHLEAGGVTRSEGVDALDALVKSVEPAAEKAGAVQSAAAYFAERASRGKLGAFDRVFGRERAGGNEAPRLGDDLQRKR